MASLRPTPSGIIAGLAMVVALLALIWSGRSVSDPQAASGPQPHQTLPSHRQPNQTELGHSPSAVASEAAPAEAIPPPPKPTGLEASATLDSLSQLSAAVVARASDSIVRVEHTSRPRITPADDLELFFGPLPPETFGSGVVVGSGGLVLTNYHVVRGATGLVVRGKGHVAQTAEVVGTDALTDLALLRAADLDLPALSWGDSRQVLSGQLVWAMGSPYGLDHSASLGIISSLNRPTLLDSPFQDFFQTDASINPGSSGGPLLDAQARIVGITTAMAADSFSGIGFALPSHIARQVYEQLRDSGVVPRGWIGVQLGQVTPARGALAGVEGGRGAYIESLASGPAVPAVEAGLRVGDICTAFEDEPVSGPVGLIRSIAGHPLDTSATLQIARGGQVLEVQVPIRPRP